jgi:hypothetical protein
VKNKNRFARSKPSADLKIAVPLAATTLSARSFLSGAFAFQGLNLGLKFLVLFRQRITASGYRFEVVSHLAVLFLKFRDLGLQFFVLLQSFCVLAGSQGQTQRYRHGKSRPSVFSPHTSSFVDKV